MRAVFKVKDLDISTGGPLIAIINQRDAEEYDLHPGDRIKLFKGKKVETVSVEISESKKSVPKNYIGLTEEVLKSLKAKQSDKLKIVLAGKPLSLDIIKKKLDGEKWTKKDIYQIIWDITHNKLNDIELTYFVSAGYTNALDDEETTMLTKAMAECGEIINFGRLVLDKHCIGGIPGNRTTMLIVPIIAAAGFTIPKSSSRSITSAAGTADTMECLAPVELPLSKLKKIVKKIKACMIWGGALNLAPADDKIIKVGRPLEIDTESKLLASILAKKASVGADRVLIDIPIGKKESKVGTKKRAIELKKKFIKIGKRLGMKVKVILTDGSQPIGNGIGPLLEARDVLWVLKRDSRRPLDLEKKSVMMAGILLQMAGVKNGKKRALEILKSGKAYKKMKEIIKAQGGNPNIDPDKMKPGKYIYTFYAKKNGKIKNIDNKAVAKIARLAGAPFDKKAGIYLYKHEKDKVRKGDKIFTLYAESKTKLEFGIDALKKWDGFVI